MRRKVRRLLSLSALPALPLQAQSLEVVASYPAHGGTDVPLVTTLSLTFNQRIELSRVQFNIFWNGSYAPGGRPYEARPILSEDGRTISFPVRHRPGTSTIIPPPKAASAWA